VRSDNRSDNRAEIIDSDGRAHAPSEFDQLLSFDRPRVPGVIGNP
jgi:hypothetical protein